MSIIPKKNLIEYWPLDGHAMGMSMRGRELYSSLYFVDSSLLGYWRLEGNSNDSKGSNNGTDTSIVYSPQLFGQGVDFDGANDYITLGNYNNSSTTVTFNVWIKYTGTTAGRVCYYFQNLSGNQLMQIQTDNTNAAGGLAVITRGSAASGTTNMYGPTAYNDGNWHMITCTWNNGVSYAYIDAVQIGTGTLPAGSILSSNTQTRIGAGYNASGNLWLGAIDDPSVFTRVLSQPEILSLYAGRLDGVVTGATPAPSQNPAIPASLAYKFSNTTDQIYIGNPGPLQLPGAQTYSLWISGANQGANLRAIISKGGISGGSDVNSVFFHNSDQTLIWYVNGGATLASVVTTTSQAGKMLNGYYNHVALVFSPSSFMKIYLNGSILAATTTGVPATMDVDQGLSIGSIETSQSLNHRDSIVAKIQEVAVFNKALTNQEVRAIYNNAKNKYRPRSSGLFNSIAQFVNLFFGTNF